MEIEVGEPVVLESLSIDFSTEVVLQTPPFPRWQRTAHSTEQIRNRVDYLREELRPKLDPRALYRVLPLDESGIEDTDPPQTILSGEYALVGLVAIAHGAEHDGGDSLLEGFLADALENVAMQLAREGVITDVRDGANELGLNTTRVIAPGAGGMEWSIENRTFVFDRLPIDRIGVELTENDHTRPRKTFTFVMGLGEDVEQPEHLLACRDCRHLDSCPYVGSVIE